MPRLQTATLPIDGVKLVKLFREWGWSPGTSGTKHQRWTQNGTTVTVRRPGASQNPTWEPVRIAAKVQGISPEAWLQGPDKADQPEVPPELDPDDLTWFTKHSSDEFKDDADQLSRYRRIRSVLSKQGLLTQYERVQHETVKSEFLGRVMEKNLSHDPITPLPVEPDSEGYVTLAQALGLRNLKADQLSRTSCELICALSEKEVSVANGRAAAMLLKRLPAGNKKTKPLSRAGLGSLIREWEKAGLIWREGNTKRTYKIGLTLPVKLTEDERVTYLWRYRAKTAAKSTEEEKPTTKEVVEQLTKNASSLVESTDIHNSFQAPIDVLTAKRDELLHDADKLLEAIDILRKVQLSQISALTAETSNTPTTT